MELPSNMANQGNLEGRRHTRDVMDHMLGMLKESMSKVEDMEEQRLLMLEAHEEEKELLREQLEAEWEEESAAFRQECARKMEEITQDMKEFEKDCERRMEEEKARMNEKRAEYERDKQEMERQARQFREDCERAMEQEKKEMEKRISESRAECDKLAAEKARSEREMVEFREEQKRIIEEEKAEAARRATEAKAELARMADERAETLKRMEQFRADCEFKMAQEKEEMQKKMREAQLENERIAEEKAAELRQKTAEYKRECEAQVHSFEAEMLRQTSNSEAEVARVTQERNNMQSYIDKFRVECEKKMEEEKADMTKQMSVFRAECEQKMQQKKTEAEAQMAASRAECARMAGEKEEMSKDMMEFRTACEKVLAEQKEDMAKKAAAAKAEIERMSTEKENMERKLEEFRKTSEANMLAEKKEAAKRMSDLKAECDRMALEKEAISRSIEQYRKDSEREMKDEKAKMAAKMAEINNQFEQQINKEKAAAERMLAETRKQTEAQLAAEREITDHVRHALRELPPLQTAMELGDVKLLEEELDKWQADVLPDRFGDCKGVVEAVVKLAQERFLTWRSVCHTMKDVLREADRLTNNVHKLQDQCHKMFRALKEAQLTKMDMKRSDPQSVSKVCELFLLWQELAMLHSNGVQKSIINKVITFPDLGPFDFADLDICLRLVDRSEEGSAIFLSRAQALVDDPGTKPKDLRPMLSHIETMLFFLKYTKSEDLRLTYIEFRKAATTLDAQVASYLSWAEQQYPPGKELVQLSAHNNMNNSQEVAAVLQQLRRPVTATRGNDPLGPFREIFYHWALAMQSKFDLLVLPHHTQVVCLLAFQCFLESRRTATSPHSLIAQVATGEGKSMIVAALAIYCVTCLGKKVHVVVDDETLLERDFGTFKSLFDAFQVPLKGRPGTRKLKSVLCVPNEKLASNRTDPSLAARVDPDADICYCEAKHVQSFYASIARAEKRDFSGYADRVLILDEVDALVIDEEPNEPFVYPNKELCEMASAVARSLRRGSTPEAVAEEFIRNPHPATQRVVREMCKEWDRAKQLQPGEDFVFAKEVGKYCKLRSGRADAKAWSLALECRNFQDDLSKEILFQERLFVMSRPRVFKKYHRILGLSGSIGSDAERRFLKETYKAAFFEVPPFLKTCKGSPFNEPVPTPLGQQKQKVYVEETADAQVDRIAEIALEAREKVPVLVIAKDRAHADLIVHGLKQAARKRGLGGAVDDVVRLLSRSLYESDPEQWKENLNRSTLPLGDRSGGGKSWRVTVTDPRGGRGTDYRVDDPDVNSLGGLLLIPALVPPSQRDWKQFLGRTARQDRRGQFCCVLNRSNYTSFEGKYKQSLPSAGGLEIVETILSWGDQEVAERIRGSAALFNSGVRLNELCEEVFGKRPDLLKDPVARERLVDVCQRLRWLSVKDIDEAFGRVSSFNPTSVPTEARDMGRPEEPMASPAVTSRRSTLGQSVAAAGDRLLYSNGASSATVGAAGPAGPKLVIFALDWSCSMMSQDCGNGMTRFGTAVKCVLRLLREQVRDQDLVSVVAFGSKVETIIPPTPKAVGGTRLEARIACLRPDMAGGTCFFDAVALCLQMLEKPAAVPANAPRWLVCLTDGDDLGSRKENTSGQLVTAMLGAGNIRCLNMMMITIGRLKERNVQVIDGWVDQVSKSGGAGRHVAEKDASFISKAFDVVAEFLAAEVGGATEC